MLTLLVLAQMAAATPAPTPSVAARCAGETITRIEYYRYASSRRSAKSLAAEAIGRAEGDAVVRPSRGERLDEDSEVLRPYVRLREGQPCLEADRADSERMLRALRFVASAAVMPLPDGPGRVRIRVDVVNEFPIIIGGNVRGVSLSALRLGTLDWRGRGRTLVAHIEDGGDYRNGGGVSFSQPAFLGRPATLSLSAAQRPLGGGAQVSLIQPFLTDGQRIGYVVHGDARVAYGGVLRGDAPTLRARTEQSSYQAAVLRRIGQPRRGRPIGLAGILIGGVLATADESLVEKRDSGLATVPDSTLRGRYPSYRANHIAAVGALRALRFSTVAGLDALRAEQDVATGAELTVIAGPSVAKSTLERDDLIGINLYLGAAGARDVGNLHFRFDGRRGRALNAGEWLSSVTHARGSWYHRIDERRMRQFVVGYSRLHSVGLPLQLSMADEDGGLVGYASSTRPGGQRLTARLEERWLVTGSRFWADLAVGAFADGGLLWRGDVPYGSNSPVLASTGLSLMAAYPSGGKRMYRLDFGVPLVRGPGDDRWVIRVSARDRTVARLVEPRDVARARLETGPATVLRW